MVAKWDFSILGQDPFLTSEKIKVNPGTALKEGIWLLQQSNVNA